MVTLILARHGEAEIPDTHSEAGDRARHLTNDGRIDVKRISTRACELLEANPTYRGRIAVISSPLIRAVQTAAIWKEVFIAHRDRFKVLPDENQIDELTNDFHADDAIKALEAARSVMNADIVIAVTHQPLVAAVADALHGKLNKPVPGFSTACAAVFSFEGNFGKSTGTLDAFFSPE